MNKMFYPKLAITNLKKNSGTYVPYILTCICTIITFYSMISISLNEGLDSIKGSESLKTILMFGTIIIGIFSVIFLFYTNSFLIKRRKKELGLYGILGLGKRHMAKVMMFETIFTSFVCLIAGLFGGMLVGKLMFLILLNMMHFKTTIAFTISVPALIITTIFFCCVFFLTMLANFLQVRLTNPISLLKGGQLGEKEPKTRWIMTSIGLVALGAGYYIALTVETPLKALTLFFLAVLLVIIGTYALFTSGSIAFLKTIRKNKGYFYKTNNFVSVSGMIYRMKQNAVGLANICILSTMVLVTLTTTVSLYIGNKEILREQFPTDISIVGTSNTTDKKGLDLLIEKESKKYHVTVKDKSTSEMYSLNALHKKNTFSQIKRKGVSEFELYEQFCDIGIISLSDYNRIENKSETLGDKELLIFSAGRDYGENTIVFGKQKFKVKKELNVFGAYNKNTFAGINRYFLIVENMGDAKSIVKSIDKELQNQDIQYEVVFNLEGSDENIQSFAKKINGKMLKYGPDVNLNSLHLSTSDWYSMFGGFLFLGVFLGALFMMATVLIIYFKQISEGYEDHNRFEIMQKVGMDKQEVKRTIRKQILMVFFIPLVCAIVHIAFAFTLITKLLVLFSLTNTTLILICTVVTALVFAAVYALVYILTARTYYKLVK